MTAPNGITINSHRTGKTVEIVALNVSRAERRGRPSGQFATH